MSGGTVQEVTSTVKRTDRRHAPRPVVNQRQIGYPVTAWQFLLRFDNMPGKLHGLPKNVKIMTICNNHREF